MKKYLDNLRQYQFLLSELVKKGIKLKYRRSYLGILWSMLEPLLSMVVLTIVFGTLYGNTDKTFPVYILSGRLLYSFYSSKNIYIYMGGCKKKKIMGGGGGGGGWGGGGIYTKI